MSTAPNRFASYVPTHPAVYYRRMEARINDVVNASVPSGTFRDVAVYVSTVRIHVPTTYARQVLADMIWLFPRSLYARPRVANQLIWSHNQQVPGVEMRYTLPDHVDLITRVGRIWDKARMVRADRSVTIALQSLGGGKKVTSGP